jgi:hypothetical protein
MDVIRNRFDRVWKISACPTSLCTSLSNQAVLTNDHAGTDQARDRPTCSGGARAKRTKKGNRSTKLITTPKIVRLARYQFRTFGSMWFSSRRRRKMLNRKRSWSRNRWPESAAAGCAPTFPWPQGSIGSPALRCRVVLSFSRLITTVLINSMRPYI